MKISFLLGIHNHQPVGNFEEVFEQAYQKSYKPFADALSRHPAVKWNLHCTGILWEWLQENHPDYLELAGVMVRRGQLELLSGGFYEPILSILPDIDKTGQIGKLNGYIKKRFDFEPKGMWCAERVWEPHLPKLISESGIQYTVLDDAHFLSAGLSKDQLTGYYRVEEQTSAIDIFPISQDLRYAIPFQDPEKAIEILRGALGLHKGEQEPALVMADDGEKFGLWPRTYSLCYEEKWLEKFLALLEKNSSWISTRTFSEYRNVSKPAGKIYLPTASYFEMSEWSLPAESGADFEKVLKLTEERGETAQFKRFLKGGIWRNFLAKYPESNSMYKKMLRVSRKVHQAVESVEKRLKRISSRKTSGESPLREVQESERRASRALDDLWAGQCNCSYWHGVFGGLYLPILRQAIYTHLIKAEEAADSLNLDSGNGKTVREKWAGALRVDQTDFDGDGDEELILETPTQNLYIAPAQGGTLFEWDFKPVSLNVTNVLTRRPETYHEKLKGRAHQKAGHPGGTKSIHDLAEAKEEGLEKILNYDWYRRAGLIDHFLHPGTGLENFRRCQYGEQGDFVKGRYDFRLEKTGREEIPGSILLCREGIVWDGNEKKSLRVEKTLKPSPAVSSGNETAGLHVTYRILNRSSSRMENILFAPEFNFSFSVPDPERDIPFSGAAEWVRRDKYLFWQLSVKFNEPSDGWVFPLETVSNSEGGFERTFQGIVFVPLWRFSLPAGGEYKKTIVFALEKTKGN